MSEGGDDSRVQARDGDGRSAGHDTRRTGKERL